MEEDTHFCALSVGTQGAFLQEMKMMTKQFRVKKMVLLAMLAAIAYMLTVLIHIPMIPAAPFLTYEPKDVVITIGGFLMGPGASLVISLVVALLEMVTVSSTGIIGCVMNFIASACFCSGAALLYKRKRNITGAVLGLLLGSAAMVCVMLLWNWLITPLYMGIPRSGIVPMLLPAFLPFNALKAGFNSALTLMLYKPLVHALRKTGLIPERSGRGSSVKWGIYLLGAALLITCAVLLLVLRGIL